MKCTMLKLELIDGSEVDLTLNFARLLKVKNHNKKLYEEFMNSLKNKDFDPIFDSIKILYVAYLCGQSADLENAMSEMEFMENVEMDMEVINTLVAELIQGKKK